MAEPIILVIEDDTHLADLIQLTLERADYRVAVAGDGRTGLERLRALRPALVVLDLMLPVLDGWEVCRQARQESDVPIIMLTARGEEADRVQGLELGADDYLVKPFSPRELVARARAILRRTGGTAPSLIEFPGLVLDLPRRLVLVRGQSVTLAPKEFELLALLAQQPGRVFTREELLKTVWGYDFVGEGRTVDEHVRRLRQKVEAWSRPYRYVSTIWGVGYKFEVQT